MANSATGAFRTSRVVQLKSVIRTAKIARRRVLSSNRFADSQIICSYGVDISMTQYLPFGRSFGY